MLPAWAAVRKHPGLPGSPVVKDPAANRRHRFNPRVGKTPLEEEMATHSVFLPGKSHRQRSLVGYSPWGPKESDMTKHTCARAHTHTHTHTHTHENAMSWMAYKQQKLIFHSSKAWMSKIRRLTRLSAGESLLPGWRFLVSSHSREKEGEASPPFPSKGTNPTHKGSIIRTSSNPDYLSKAPPLNMVTLRGGVSTDDFWEGSIHSTTPALSVVTQDITRKKGFS